MEDQLDLNHGISSNSQNDKAVFLNLKDAITISKEVTNNSLQALKKKMKEHPKNDLSDIYIVKRLQNVHAKGCMLFEELTTINNYIDVVRFFDESILKLKGESRKLVAENKRTKISLKQSEKELHAKECQLVIIEEKKEFYKEMISLYKYDIEGELIDIEYDIWHRCLYDRLALNNWQTSKYHRSLLKKISTSTLSEAVTLANTTLLTGGNDDSTEDPQSIHQESLCLLLVTKYCYEYNLFEESLKFGNKIIKRTKAIHLGKTEFFSKLLACVALIYYKLKDSKKVAIHATESLKLLEVLSESDGDLKSSYASQSVSLGYMFCHGNLVKDGIQLMESGIIAYSQMLPQEESNWMDALALLARVCNDFNFLEDAMIVCERLITFFHNKHVCMTGSDWLTRNIFDISVEAEEKKKYSSISSVEVPPPITLPRSVQSVLSELTIVFSKNNLFTGAQILSKWLRSCRDPSTHPLKKCESRYLLELDSFETKDVSGCPNLTMVQLTSKLGSTNEGSKFTLNMKPFSSKLSSLFRHRTNKVESPINGDNENNLNVKKIFKMFKKVI